MGADRVSGHDGIGVIIPPRKDAKPSHKANESPTQRDEHTAAIKRKGRRRWEATSGYGRRNRAENTMYRYKTIIGRAVRGRLLRTQQTETRIGCKIPNIMKRLVPMKDPLPV